EIRAVHSLRHGEDLVQRERALQHGLERELERFALELLRTLLELALEVRSLALRGLELRLPLRLAAAELLADLGARLLLDALALGIELALVLEVLVLLRFVELAELPAKRELFLAEAPERGLLRAQGLVQRLCLDVELRLRLGGKPRLECLAAFGDRALEFAGVAFDRLAREAFAEREAVVALRAGHRLFGLDDDRASHSYSQKIGVRALNQEKTKFGL